MRFYWCQDLISQKCFSVYWNSEEFNLGNYDSKHHAEKNHHMVWPIYLNKNKSPRDIPKNAAVGLRKYVDYDQGNA